MKFDFRFQISNFKKEKLLIPFTAETRAFDVSFSPPVRKMTLRAITITQSSARITLRSDFGK